jgi:hypothetical protein
LVAQRVGYGYVQGIGADTGTDEKTHYTGAPQQRIDPTHTVSLWHFPILFYSALSRRGRREQ